MAGRADLQARLESVLDGMVAEGHDELQLIEAMVGLAQAKLLERNNVVLSSESEEARSDFWHQIWRKRVEHREH